MLTDAIVIGTCAALVAAGVAIVVRWGGEPTPRRGGRSPLPGLARYGALVGVAGVVAGGLAAGAGGRLAMRLLAITSPSTHGQITENGAAIGEITLGGTVAFVLFVGLLSGLISAAVYLLMSPLLPRGRLGGVALGAILLVLAGARIEPLRTDNFDFALVGPDWLSVLLFVALALFQGMLVVALAGRLAGAPPRLRAWRALAVATGVLALLALPGFVGAVADVLAPA